MTACTLGFAFLRRVSVPTLLLPSPAFPASSPRLLILYSFSFHSFQPLRLSTPSMALSTSRSPFSLPPNPRPATSLSEHVQLLSHQFATLQSHMLNPFTKGANKGGYGKTGSKGGKKGGKGKTYESHPMMWHCADRTAPDDLPAPRAHVDDCLLTRIVERRQPP